MGRCLQGSRFQFLLDRGQPPTHDGTYGAPSAVHNAGYALSVAGFFGLGLDRFSVPVRTQTPMAAQMMLMGTTMAFPHHHKYSLI